MSNLNRYRFRDVGSWINGVVASSEIEAAARAALEKNSTNVPGWKPTYDCRHDPSFQAVKMHDLTHAGAGKAPIMAR